MSYEWTAKYTDGTRLQQVEPDGTKNAYYDIDQERLQAFQLWDGDTIVVAVAFQPGERLVWRRRTAATPGEGDQICHVIGKRRPVAEQLEVSSVICVFESDGRTLTADGFDQDHPWLYAPQIHDYEGGDGR